jgi:polyhydroxybutyrate depolymerase
MSAFALVGCPSTGESGETDTETDTDGSGTGPSSGVTASGSSASGMSGSGASNSDGTTTQQPTTDPSATTEPGTESGEETTASGCGASTLEPGRHEGLVLEFDGIERTYDLLVPASYDGATATPFVLNFHGYLIGNPAQQAMFSQMDMFAEDAGVIVAYPAGVNASWNAGACCGDGMSMNIDDVGFVRALVEHISGMLCVDPDRVFATGMSNGGFLSHRLACEAGDLVAAIGPVAGVLGVDPATCTGRAVPVMHFHGTSDFIVSYNGGIFRSVAETMAFWVEHNGCAAEPEVTFMMGDTTCETWSGCTDGADVVLCTIEGGGHCWPGNTDCPVMVSTEQIHASEAVLQFFADHPMP